MVLFTITAICFAQKIKVNETNNNIRRISTDKVTIEIPNYFDFRIELFIDASNNRQYFIRGDSETNEYHNIPEHGKLLFKTFDESIVELTACYSELVQVSQGEWQPIAYYPISENNLRKLFMGVAKVRVELLSYNKKDQSVFQDLQDVSYKKDKLGKKFEKMYLAIEEEQSKNSINSKSIDNKNIDATSGF